MAALLAAGADVAAKAQTGKTPLHWAALGVNPHAILPLVRAGADLEARDEDSRTPLHVAAARNPNPASIAALLDAGADTKARDKDGKTPWDLAQNNEALKGSAAYRRLNDRRF